MSRHRIGCKCLRCSLPMGPLWSASSKQATTEQATGGHVEAVSVPLDDHGGSCLCDACVDEQVIGGAP